MTNRNRQKPTTEPNEMPKVETPNPTEAANENTPTANDNAPENPAANDAAAVQNPPATEADPQNPNPTDQVNKADEVTKTKRTPIEIDAYQDLTDRTIVALEQGAATRQMLWHQAAPKGLPLNASTGAEFRGANAMQLWLFGEMRGNTSRYWATYKQWMEAGRKLNRGAKGCPVFFFKQVEKTTPEGRKYTTTVTEVYNVFNASDIEGWKEPDTYIPSRDEMIVRAEMFIENTGAIIKHEGQLPMYSGAEDKISIPRPGNIANPTRLTKSEQYIVALFREMAEWTGNNRRLAWDFFPRFGAYSYAIDRLTAEFATAFLCAEFGIRPEFDPEGHHLIPKWLTVLRGDKSAVSIAATQAAKAVNYMKSLQPEKPKEETLTETENADPEGQRLDRAVQELRGNSR